MLRLCILTSTLLTVNLLRVPGAPASSYWQQHVDYVIHVSLDDQASTLRGDIQITYTNHSPDTLTFIWMHLWPNAYTDNATAFARQKLQQGSTAFQFAPASEKGYIDSLDFTVDGKGVTTEPSYTPDIVKLILDTPLFPGQTAVIHTPFHVKIPYCFSRMGHTGQQYQISQWYPKPAVYDSRGWHPIPYLDQGEFYSEFGNFDVFITLPSNYIVAASGDLQNPDEVSFLNRLAEENKTASYDPKDLAFPPSAATQKTLEYKLINAHDFAWFADKRFHVDRDSTTTVSGKPVSTYVYFLNDQADIWRNAAEYVSRAVKFYSDHVGEYAWNIAQAVEGSLGVSGAGGMEYPTVTVISGKYKPKSLDDVITHEVGHNWFYGMLGTNERDHAWMDEGINTYYENRYMQTFYGSPDLLGIPTGSGTVGRLLGLDSISAYGLLWDVLSIEDRQNKSQPLDMTAADFSEINYGLIVYEETAYYLTCLADYLTVEQFDRIMHAYFDTWRMKHPYPDDMKEVFNAQTGEDFSWFFDDLLQHARGVDYVLKGMENGKKAMAVTVKNRSDYYTPFSIALMHGDSILRQDWFRGFTGSQTVFLNKDTAWKVTSVKLDPQGFVPDINRENNTLKTSGLFKRTEPLQIRPFFGLDNPNKTTIYYLPFAAWNNNDRWMPGLGIWNSTLPEPAIEYVFAPMYALGSKQFTGQGSIGLNLYPGNGAFSRIRMSEFAKSYSYSAFNIAIQGDENFIASRFIKYETKLEGDIRKKQFISNISQHVQARYIRIAESYPIFLYNAEHEVSGLDTRYQRYDIGEISYELRSEKALFPFGWTTAAQAGPGFTRLFTDFHCLILYPKSKLGVNVRFFAGGFISAANDLETRYNFSLQGTPSYFDFAYDGMYFGRNAPDGILSRQITMQDGFFKVPVYAPEIASSDGFLSALNLRIPFPFKLPVALFADAAYIAPQNLPSDFSHFQYDGGLLMRLPDNIFEIYFPLVYSDDIKNAFPAGLKYKNKITFLLDLNALNVFEKMRKLSFL